MIFEIFVIFEIFEIFRRHDLAKPKGRILDHGQSSSWIGRRTLEGGFAFVSGSVMAGGPPIAVGTPLHLALVDQ